jgi:putative transposase
MTHVRTSPFHRQSNGKIECWHQSLKGECIRPGVRLLIEDGRRLVARYVEHYNRIRLRAIGYLTPLDKVQGREQQIFAERARKLERADASGNSAARRLYAISYPSHPRGLANRRSSV